MPAGLRRQGVYGESNPTKKTQGVQPATFTIGALMGFFERKFAVSFPANTPQDAWRIFGQRLNQPSAYYGPDIVDGFFANLKGASGNLIIAAPNWAGDVAATQQIPDTMVTPQYPLTVGSGIGWGGTFYPQYGVLGNRIGVRIEQGPRFVAAVAAAGGQTALNTPMTLASVAQVYPGDIVYGAGSGGTPGQTYAVIATVNYATGQVTVNTQSGAAWFSAADIVQVIGFRIHTWYKGANGIEQEVDAALGQMWLSLNPNAVPYYALNVMVSSSYLTLTMGTTTSTPDKKYPSGASFTGATTLYPTNGTDGTQPANAAAWTALFPILEPGVTIPLAPVMGCLPETTDIPTQKALETYFYNRVAKDMPKALVHGPEAMSKSSMIAWGNQFQRSNDVMQVSIGHWLLVTDPYQSSSLAPPRHVPATGHAMGAWCASIYYKGIHYIPATKDISLSGCIGVSGDQILGDQDRTDVCNAGVNVIQQLPGYGIVIRNFYTPSTQLEFQWANGVLMREFIKASCVQSMQGAENTPNSLNYLREGKQAIWNFMMQLWNKGSTGNVPEGETFGQSQDPLTGNPTKFADHVEIKGDIINNPQASLNAGNRNYDVYFTFPAPAGSIRIGVGLMLRG